MVASLTSHLTQPATAIRQLALRGLLAAATLASLTMAPTVPAASARARHCPYAHTRVGTARAAQLRRAVVCLINKERRRHHLPALRASGRLNHSAQGWTNSMVHHDIFTHGAHFAARITAAGFSWSRAGENIATGFSTPASVVRAWMASPGHCQNILNPLFREVGTGVTRGRIPGYSSRPSTWAQDFGLGMSQRPLSGNFGPAAGCPY